MDKAPLQSLMSGVSAVWTEAEQLALIERIGQVGFWYFDTSGKAVRLTASALERLVALTGIHPPASNDTLAVFLSEAENRRLQSALALAMSRQLPLHIELCLSGDGQATIALQGAPQGAGQDDSLRYAGIFSDITRQKRAEIERETVISQLNALLGSLPVGVTVFDEDLRLIFWNDHIYDILGLPQGAVYKFVRFEELIRYPAERGEYGPGDPAELVAQRAQLARRFEPHRFERAARNGRTLLVEGYPFRFGGHASGFVTIYTDVTERKRAEAQLLQQNSILNTIIDHFPGGVSLFDGNLRMVAWNAQLKRLLDLPDDLFSKESVWFEDLARFNAQRGEYGPGEIESLVAGLVARARNFQAHKFERVRPNGQALEVRGTPLPGGGFVSIYIDITERRRAEERIRVMALQDSLTGLPNRINLNDQVQQAIERFNTAGQRFALLFLDLDGFKKINDQLGHDAGDALLIQVAERLRAGVHTTDVVARLGGDEFIVLLRDVADEIIPERIAAALVESLSHPFGLAGRPTQIGTSIGIARFPEHGPCRETLLKAADQAMYQAKAAGRGTFRTAVNR